MTLITSGIQERFPKLWEVLSLPTETSIHAEDPDSLHRTPRDTRLLLLVNLNEVNEPYCSRGQWPVL